MEIVFEELSHANLKYAREIDRSDISEAFVDTADTIMNITDYGIKHGCIGHTYIVKIDNLYVGFLLLGEAIPWDTDPIEMKDKPFYRLMGFVIDKKHRSKGLGGMILEEAIDKVYKDFGRRSIVLCCHKDNERAANFYIKHGFKRTGVFEGNDEYFLRLI